MNYNRLKKAYEDWLATSPSPVNDAAFIAWMSANVSSARTTISGDDLLDQLVLADYAAFAAPQRELFNTLTLKEALNVAPGTGTRSILSALFPNPSDTRTNLIALITSDRSEPRHSTYSIGPVGQPHIERLRADGRIG